VACYAAALAQVIELDEKEVKEIKVAAFLHDIGKVDIPEEILNKPGPLNREEFEKIKRHPATGAGIVRQIKSLENIAASILHHHERYDGKGYPDGLAAEAIPLASRLIALADSFDAMISHRPYRRAMTFTEALGEIEEEAGRQFDPFLAQLFIDNITDFLSERKIN
jgi:putative nucleotidyltransferase with HDIG domain